MSENYTHYLGSDFRDTYEENVRHVLDHEEYELIDKESLQRKLNIIQTEQAGILRCMESLSIGYSARASRCLLLDRDLDGFRYNAYVAGKLSMMGAEENGRYNSFMVYMSDNDTLYEYARRVDAEYPDQNPWVDFLLEDWKGLEVSLAERIKNPPVKSTSKVRVEIYHTYNKFYQAVLEKDKKVMADMLNHLLEKRIARSDVRYAEIHHAFYLQINVLSLAKIALRQGIDLGIDHPTAPKELIEIRPLTDYPDPYPFMATFDYHQSHKEWIANWRKKIDAFVKARDEQEAAERLANQGLKGVLNRLKKKVGHFL